MAVISVLEQHILIDQALQRFSAFTNRDVDPAEIDIQLNRAMYNVIEEFLGPAPLGKDAEGFERNTRVLDMLRPLVTSTVPTEYALTGYDFPDDYYHLIKASVEIGKDCEGIVEYKYEKVRIGETEDEDELIDHPFAKSDVKSLLGFIKGSTLTINIPNGYVTRNIKIDYIRTPQQIKFATDTNGNYDPSTSQDCELEGDGAYKVTDYTIEYMSAIIDNPPNKVNIFQNEKVN